MSAAKERQGMIRIATIDDCRAIADVHVASWRSSYVGQVPNEYLARLSVATSEAQWREVFFNKGHRILVAEAESEGFHGFVSFGPSRDADSAQNTGEIYALYLRQESQRRGIGSVLWNSASNLLVKGEYSALSVWVLVSNLKARAFYEQKGCQLDGAEKSLMLGNQQVVEVRYHLPLWQGVCTQ
jgi:ribosomal protein S18 acetylase RimI-like enzyme